MRTTIALATACFMCGCATGPDYRPPALSTAAGGSWLYLPQAIATHDEIDDRWWLLYGDPNLDAVVREAVASNTDIRIAEANFEASRATLLETRAARLPSTNIAAGGSYGRSSTASQIANATGRRAKDLWLDQTGFDMSYEVDLFGRVQRTVEAAHADADAVRAARDEVRLTIVAEAVRNYVAACALGTQITVARHALAIAEVQSGIVRKQVAAGGAGEFELARQTMVEDRTRSNVPALEGDRRATLFALAALLGRPPSGIPQAAATCRTTPEIKGTVAVGDGSKVLERRPDVREAERKMAAASARIGVEMASLRPRITLLGSVNSIGPDLSDVGRRSGTSFGLGPFITWTFPNIAAARARIQRARASDRAAVASYDGAVLTALKEVEQALSRYAAALERERDLVGAETNARRAYTLAQSRLKAGSLSRLDTLFAEQSLIDAQLAVSAARSSRAELLIALFKALGGGWR